MSDASQDATVDDKARATASNKVISTCPKVWYKDSGFASLRPMSSLPVAGCNSTPRTNAAAPSSPQI